MSVLRPIPMHVLVRRAVAELPKGAIFDLPVRRVFKGFPGADLSVSFHGRRCATPLGPAAGPHTQLAQNIALSWLAGGRILELKTVQVNDRLEIPRPCIDMATLGLNVEWSQELLVEDALREYVKGRLLVSILGELAGVPERERAFVLDLSVGYSLDGIRSRKMADFFAGARDAGPLLERERRDLRHELPPPLRHLADAPCDARLSDSVTLSTFHGCPADEIAAICRHLLAEEGLHTIVKLNPTLLGYEEVEDILHARLGYTDVRLSRGAFERDLKWDEAVSLARDLAAEARRQGLFFGAKLTNTLVIENGRSTLPGPDAYLSGEPLHVLALNLALRFREAVDPGLPMSFSAGIDATNVAAAVSCGFAPVTSCTDLLRPGGFERLHWQAEALANALMSASSSTVPELILARAGGADRSPAPGSLATAKLRDAALTNHRRAAAEALASPHYRTERTSKPPKKIGEHLHLMDCINCDKCVPVCPNDANFVYDTPPRTVTYRDLVVKAGRLVPGEDQTFSLGGKKVSSHQIGNYADACNDCGNCDVFCPEDGGPYIEKPRLFGSLASLLADAPRPGFFAWRDADGSLAIRGRWSGRTVELHAAPDGRTFFWDGVAELTFASAEAIEPVEARVLALPPPEGHVVPVGLYHALRALLSGLFAPGAVSWVNAPYLSKEATT